ncbi:MAG: two-component system sensor histidine kinase NtrB [Terriglobales bacterium]
MISEFQARTVLNATSEGIYVVDPEGCCLWSNSAAARIFGYESSDAYIGKQMHGMMHHTRPDGTPFPEAECRGLQGLRAGAGVVQSRELLWRADGTHFYADVRVNPVFEGEAMQFAVVVLRDITERMRLEEHFQHAQKMEAVGRIAAGTAHDFNNLLTVISGYAQLLLRDPPPDPVSLKRLQGIKSASVRAAILTRQLLEFSRLEPTNPTPIVLNTVVAAAEPLVRSTTGDTIALHISLAPELPAALVDFNEMEQVLMNLVVNACDAMPAGGALHIGTRCAASAPAALRTQGLPEGACAVLEVADTGVGMDEATRTQMFEPFFTTKPPSQGTGLGLAMVMTAVRQSDGAIAVESAPGKGTNIQIYLPVAPAAQASAKAAAGFSG